MRQRLVRIESRNAGVVVTVSDRALSVRFPMLMSFAQDGINPQRMVVKWRIFLPCSLRRSEEHTSELQSRLHLVCRLLLEKKKKKRLSLYMYDYDDIVNT